MRLKPKQMGPHKIVLSINHTVTIDIQGLHVVASINGIYNWNNKRRKQIRVGEIEQVISIAI